LENVGRSGVGQRFREAVIVVYSLIVIATDLPAFGGIPNVVVIPYFLFIPGYCLTSLITPTDSIIEKTFYTLAWSLALAANFIAINTLRSGLPVLPIKVVVPVLTLLILAFKYFHGR
jgi:uncharacterized membrane protein